MGSSLPDGGNDKMMESSRELGELKMKSWRLLMQGCVPDVKSDGCTLQSLNGISEREKFPKTERSEPVQQGTARNHHSAS